MNLDTPLFFLMDTETLINTQKLQEYHDNAVTVAKTNDMVKNS